MNENYLSPAEIEALLGHVAPEESAVSMSHGRGREAVSSQHLPVGDATSDADARAAHRESAADRKRRNRLWAIHEQAARDAGIALSATLRAAVDVRLTGIDAMSCHALAASMETPTCICMLRSPAVGGQLVLELPAAILLPMLDRMLGGSVSTISTAAPRPLSEIEQRLALRIGSCLAGEINRAWESTHAIALSVDRVETDARWLSIGPPESDAIVASFDVRLGKARGTLRFGIPPQSMDVLEHFLLAEARSAIAGPHRPTIDRLQVAKDQTELTVELAASPITGDDIANLNAGDVIATEHRIDSPVIVKVDGEPKFLGRLGATAGRKAVRLEHSFDDSAANE